MTVTAVWEDIYYTVTYRDGADKTTTVSVKHGDTLKLPECEFTAPEGKKFKAWQIGTSEYAVGTEVVVTADMTVTAVWEDIYYTVTYSDGGNWISTERVKHGDTLELSKCMFTAPAGKTFKAWEIDGVEFAVGEEIIVTENVTVTAIWKNTSENTGASYDVTVDAVEGGTICVTPAEAVAGSIVTVTVTPDEGSELDELIIRDATGKTIEWTPAGENEYIFVMPDSEVTISVVFRVIGTDCPKDTTCPIWPFQDSKTTAWYHDGVHYCIENGLMNGLSADLFAPNGTTTRAQIVTILWRLEGKPVVNYAMSFNDVAADQWYTEAVRWAAAEGIVLGYSDAEFAPNVAITREQMAAILYRYCQYKEIDVSVGEDTNILSYTDAFDVHSWAMEAMQWACGAGVVGGIADGNGMKLDPTGTATRAQVATMLWRFCEEIMEP